MAPLPGPRSTGRCTTQGAVSTRGECLSKNTQKRIRRVRDLPNRHGQDRARGAVGAHVVNGWESSPPLPVRSHAQAAVRLIRRLIPAPGPAPAPASGPLAGLDCANWSSCRGQHRSLWQASRRRPSHDDASTPPTNLWPATGEIQLRHSSCLPSLTPRKKFACRGRGSPRSSPPPTAIGPRPTIETGLHSKIGPNAVEP